MSDYYEVLGLSRDASQDDVKRAFRKLARETHPDANPNDARAEGRFREVAEAYEVLSDPQKRAAYDRGEVFGSGDLFANFGGLDEILQQFFGGSFGGFGFRSASGPSRGSDVAVAAEVTLEEAAVGVSRDLLYTAPTRCEVCAGSGSEPGHDPMTCPTCGGRGQVQINRNTFLGSMMTVTECATCRGRGRVIEHVCDECGGAGRVTAEQAITVEIPAGVDDGTRLRLAGRGGAGEPGAPAGDLYLQVRVLADPRFQRVGDDLHHVARIGLAEAALGTAISVPAIDGEDFEVDIPAGTQPGTVFQSARRGMPRLRRRGRGDLLIEVKVDVPAELSPDAEEALRSYATATGEQPMSPRRRRRRQR